MPGGLAAACGSGLALPGARAALAVGADVGRARRSARSWRPLAAARAARVSPPTPAAAASGRRFGLARHRPPRARRWARPVPAERVSRSARLRPQGSTAATVPEHRRRGCRARSPEPGRAATRRGDVGGATSRRRAVGRDARLRARQRRHSGPSRRWFPVVSGLRFAFGRRHTASTTASEFLLSRREPTRSRRPRCGRRRPARAASARCVRQVGHSWPAAWPGAPRALSRWCRRARARRSRFAARALRPRRGGAALPATRSRASPLEGFRRARGGSRARRKPARDAAGAGRPDRTRRSARHHLMGAREPHEDCKPRAIARK